MGRRQLGEGPTDGACQENGASWGRPCVPICPELRALLAEAFERAEPGATSIVPMASRPGVNLRTYLERIIGNAGHSLWPRLLQNLRASCATDWVGKYPSHVVAKWLGQSPKVAAQHYLMSRDHHFEDVVGGGEASPRAVSRWCRGASQSATRNAHPLRREMRRRRRPHPAARSRTKRQNPLPPLRLQRVLSGIA
jgi:hypothetical protein